MKETVSVTRQQRIAATPAVVWEVVADPSMQERLDRRCHLESTSGDWRSVGSEFVLVARGARLRYVVSDAEPGVRWTATVERAGRQAGVQSGELSADGPGTLLRWTVTLSVGPLLRRLAERSCERELSRWLAAVEREALAGVR